MAIDTGTEAPDFTLKDQDKNEVTLSSFRGDKNVVLVFFPFAFTGICESEVCALRDDLGALEAHGAQVLAVSCDAVPVLKRWQDDQNFGYPLLSDFWPHGATATAYGVFNETLGCADRGTFIIDRTGVVRFAEHNPPGERRDVERYGEILQSLD